MAKKQLNEVDWVPMPTRSMHPARRSHTESARRMSSSISESVAAVVFVINALVLGLVRVNDAWRSGVFCLCLGILCLVLVRRMARSLRDNRLRRLSLVFAVKLAVGTTLLLYCWAPDLPTATPWRGFDPMRYYWAGQRLLEGGFHPDSVAQESMINRGVVYWVAFAFLLLGTNPIAPFLANCLLTLLASIMLISTAYAEKTTRARWDWKLGLWMLIPQFVWYDVQSGRDTLTANGVVLAVCAFVLVSRRGGTSTALLGLFGICVIGFIRCQMLPAVFLIVIMLQVMKVWRVRRRRLLAVVIVVVIAVVGLTPSLFARVIGGRGFSGWNEEFRRLDIEADRTYLVLEKHQEDFSESSIGRLLIPPNTYAIPFYLPVRAVSYLVIPLPGSLVGLFSPAVLDWSWMNRLSATMTSLLCIACTPYLLGAVHLAIKAKPGTRTFVIPLAILLVTIAGATVILHVRYRVVAIPWLAASAWIGALENPQRLRVYLAHVLSASFSIALLYYLFKMGGV